LTGDRRAMLINSNDDFISLRTHPKMAYIKPYFRGNELVLDVNGETVVANISNLRTCAKIKSDVLNVSIAESSVNKILSEFFNEGIRLVFMDEFTTRTADVEWAKSNVSLADNMPISIVNTASFNELSTAVGCGISIDQFRPNLVVNGNLPWVEDCWRTLRVGDAVIDVIHPISRCKIVTLSPKTGEQDHIEVMKTLIKERRSGDARIKGVLFGWAAVVRNPSKVHVGDTVEILESREPWPIRH